MRKKVKIDINKFYDVINTSNSESDEAIKQLIDSLNEINKRQSIWQKIKTFFVGKDAIEALLFDMKNIKYYRK